MENLEQEWQNKGRYYIRYLGNYREAINCFDEALKINPHNIHLWLEKANTYFVYLELYDDAIKSLEKALEIKSDFFEAVILLAEIYNNTQRFEEAMKMLARAAEINKVNPNDQASFVINADKGYSFLNMGRFDEALKFNPNNVIALHGVALALTLYTDNYSKALDYVERALKVNPEYIYAMDTKALLLNQLKKYQAALELYDKVLKKQPSDFFALNNKGVVIANLGLYQQALKWYDKALKQFPGNLDMIANKEGYWE